MAEIRLAESENRVCGRCALHQLLDNTEHPGGLKMTMRLAEVAQVKRDVKILEIGCGRGTTAIYFAQNYGCMFTGIDLSPAKIAEAKNSASREHLSHKMSLMVADDRALPFSPDSFDVIVSECSLSVQPDKEKVVAEIKRVLKPGGRLVFTDLVIRDGASRNPLAETEEKAVSLPCIANAKSIEWYLELLKKTGFQDLYNEDQSWALKEAQFRIGLSFGGIKKSPQEQAASCTEPGELMPLEVYKVFMKQGNLGYALIAATKPEERICQT